MDDLNPPLHIDQSLFNNLFKDISGQNQTASKTYDLSSINIDSACRSTIEIALASWSFSAHHFSDDELLIAALIIFQSALSSPLLQKWNIPSDKLLNFLMACRAAYNSSVYYHNFRHVVDVLQAVYHFLQCIGALPPSQHFNPSDSLKCNSLLSNIINAKDAFSLLLAAIGHDVGHPGVNNAFLIATKSPLAIIYNDKSVLESYHSAAFSQILKHYWPSVGHDSFLRKRLISSIFATDMSSHFKFIKDLEFLKKQFETNHRVASEWTEKELDEKRIFLCDLLIKCADISNVTREFDTARKWAYSLGDEFSYQGLLEKKLDLPSCLPGGPFGKDNVVNLAQSQIGFINIFALPLFEPIAQIFPSLSFCVKELKSNRSIWEEKIKEAKSNTNYPDSPLRQSSENKPVDESNKFLKSTNNENQNITNDLNSHTSLQQDTSSSPRVDSLQKDSRDLSRIGSSDKDELSGKATIEASANTRSVAEFVSGRFPFKTWRKKWRGAKGNKSKEIVNC